MIFRFVFEVGLRRKVAAFFGAVFGRLRRFYFFKSKGIELGKPPALRKCGRFFIAPLKIYLLKISELRKELKKVEKKLENCLGAVYICGINSLKKKRK